MNTATKTVTLEAQPAVMGWAIIAKCDSKSYVVETGLVTPKTRLRHWQKNLPLIQAAIEKASR